MSLESLNSLRRRGGERLSQVEWGVSVIANVILFVMAWAIAIDAILRYLFGSPFQISVPMVTELYLLPAFVFGAAGYVQMEGGNISVDIFHKDFSPRRKHLVNLLGRTGAFAVFAPMSYLAFRRGLSLYREGASLIGVVAFPTSYTYFFISIGLVFLCIRFVRQLIVDIEVLAGRRAPTEPGPTDPGESVR